MGSHLRHIKRIQTISHKFASFLTQWYAFAGASNLPIFPDFPSKNHPIELQDSRFSLQDNISDPSPVYSDTTKINFSRWVTCQVKWNVVADSTQGGLSGTSNLKVYARVEQGSADLHRNCMCPINKSMHMNPVRRDADQLLLIAIFRVSRSFGVAHSRYTNCILRKSCCVGTS